MVTCLVNSFRPQVGFASIELLKGAACKVSIPKSQTCCGQANYNSGDMQGAKELAKKTIKEFEKFDYIVAPSGSCIGSIKAYPSLFNASDDWHSRAQNFIKKTYELTSFLVEVLGFKPAVTFEENVTYHDACTGLRELDIKEQPRNLLKAAGAKIIEMDEGDVCCGFGGLFSVKFSDISDRIVENKTAHIENTDAQFLAGGDLGCLMNMAGKLKRLGSNITVHHVAEILAGHINDEGILGNDKS
jgi:L-lactate dehydrogenase complex protein LldE